MNRMTDSRDRESWLYLKPPNDYKLGYHQKVQEGRSKSTLKQNPQLKLGKFVERDRVCEFKDQFKIMNERDRKQKED